MPITYPERCKTQKQISLWLDKSLANKLEAHVRNNDLDRSKYVRSLIRKALSSKSK